MDDMGPSFGYNLAILLHVIGILLLFAAIALEVVIYQLLTAAKTPAQLRATGQRAALLGKQFSLASGLILLSGIYLSWLHISHGGEYAWLVIAIIVFVAMGAYGAANGRRTRDKVMAAAKRGGGLKPGELDEHNVPVGGMMFLSIVVLMIFQPDWLVSIVVAVACLLAGLALAANINQRRQAKPASSPRIAS